jgi:hypothetical protein
MTLHYCPEHLPADATEAINTYASSHLALDLSSGLGKSLPVWVKANIGPYLNAG